MEMDCLTTTVDDIRTVRASISSSITEENARFCGFAGWFDVHFRVSFCIIEITFNCYLTTSLELTWINLITQGSSKNPAQSEIELTTAPSYDSGTHWGQQVGSTST